jgi:hypothetical protein
MSYRPLTDVWILARPKVKYYGAYPSGFLSRARVLLGVSIADPVLHVCSGALRDYPFKGLGPADRMVDGNALLGPDYTLDVTIDPLPSGFKAHLADPPYTPQDALKYGDLPFPSASLLLQAMLDALPVGGRAGMLHYEWPAVPKSAREVAVVGVFTGRRQRARVYTVVERIK